jgi:hypothetical protein
MRNTITHVNNVIALLDYVENRRDLSPIEWNFKVSLKKLQASLLENKIFFGSKGENQMGNSRG